MAETAQTVEKKVDENQNQENNAENGNSKTQAQSVEFSEVTEAGVEGSGTNIDILLDMKLPVTVAVGQTEITVQRLLQLGPGSVLKLDKPIDAPADLYLKDTRFATGTVVVVDDKFAIRIKQILGAGDAAGPENRQ